MNGSVTELKSVALDEIQTDIENTLNGRERVVGLIALLEAQREKDKATFVKGFATELAAVKGRPDKVFADAQFAKYTNWEKADVDLGNRIAAMTKTAEFLGERFTQFSTTYRTETVRYLRVQIDAIAVRVVEEDSETAELTKRKSKLQAELDKLLGTTSQSAKKTARKNAAKKAAAKKTTAKKTAKKTAAKRARKTAAKKL